MSERSRVAASSVQLALVTLAISGIALSATVAGRAWIVALAVQTLVIWNMWSFAPAAPFSRKLLSCVPMAVASGAALWAWEPVLAPSPLLAGPAAGVALAAVLSGFLVLNVYRARDFLAQPELVEFLQPDMNRTVALAETSYLVLGAIAEELMFRAFPALFLADPAAFFALAVGSFVLVHHINPWSPRTIDPLRLAEHVAMAVLLTLIFMGFGLGWAILAHVLYNLTARCYYATYLLHR